MTATEDMVRAVYAALPGGPFGLDPDRLPWVARTLAAAGIDPAGADLARVWHLACCRRAGLRDLTDPPPAWLRPAEDEGGPPATDLPDLWSWRAFESSARRRRAHRAEEPGPSAEDAVRRLEGD